MFAKVGRGERMAGLMVYLVGEGRANEHTEPHLVAGDGAMMAWHGDAELSRASAFAIARHLDRPRVVHGAHAYEDRHVWHCSLSLSADEGMLTDEKWGQIAEGFVRAMEFDDVGGTEAPCRWVAVRHGVSKNGNDHVHLVVNLVREDGSLASIDNDYVRARAASRALEVEYGLEELESARAERGTRGYDRAEREAQARARARAKHERARRGGHHGTEWTRLPAAERNARVAEEMRADQPRYVLALRVRGCAEASASEAEFVRRARRAGLLVRPRYADGRTDVVVGYSVAERPSYGERPVWYGGGHLARDLTLPRLRDGWPDTPEGAGEAVAEWNAARHNRRAVVAGRESVDPDPQTWDRVNADLGALVERLRAVPLDDRSLWATVARQTAGALAAWSQAVEPIPGDLAAAAEALSRSAQTFRRTVRPARAGTVAISDAAMLVAAAATGGHGLLAQTVMIRQMLHLAQAVHAAAQASGQARQARLLADDARRRLARVRDSLPRPADRPPTPRPDPAGRPSLDPQVRAMLDRVRLDQARPAREATGPAPARTDPVRPVRTTDERDAQRGLDR